MSKPTFEEFRETIRKSIRRHPDFGTWLDGEMLRALYERMTNHSADASKMVEGGVSFELAAVVTEDNKLIPETLCLWEKRDLLTVDPFLEHGVHHHIVKLRAVEVKP